MVNVYKALIAYLKADTAVAGEVGTRVFVPELPQDQANSMPRRCVVIRPAGGPGRPGDYVRLTKFRIDVFNYGETANYALSVQRATHEALKNLDRDRHGDTLLHCADESSAPIWLRDPDGNWPLFLESWLVLASSVTAV